MSFLFKTFFLIFFIPLMVQAQQALQEGLYADKIILHGKNSWGFKNKKGNWEIKPQFDSIYHSFEFGKAIASKDQHYGVIDINGKIIIPFIYQEILPQVKHLFPVRSDEFKWGFVSVEGEVIVPMWHDNFRLSYKDKHLLLQKELRWGIYSVSHEELIPPLYKQINNVNNKLYKALPFAHWQILQSNGTALYAKDTDTLQTLNTATACYTIQGKKGICSSTKELCSAQFENILPAHDSLYFVQKNNYWGVATGNGHFIMEPQFEAVKAYPNYFIATLKYREQKIYTWHLKPLTTSSYLNISDSSNGLWAVQNTIDLWGYLNAKGELSIPCRYSKVEHFHQGLAKVTLEGISYYINTHEEQIITPSECAYYESGFLKVNSDYHKSYIKGFHEYERLEILSDQYYRVQSKKGYGILNDNGDLVLPCEYNSIELSKDEKLLIAQKKKLHYLYTISGQLIGMPHKRFERMIDASEGLVKIKYKGGLGFCDLEGRIIISTQYDATDLFHEGICAVKLRGKWAYIDTEERFILQPYYNEPATFYGKAGIIQENNDYHLINTKGKLTLEYPLQHIERTTEGFYIIQNKAGLYGLANASGKELFPPKYKNITSHEGGVFIVTDDEYSGAIDATGKIVVSIKYHTLFYDPLLKLYSGSVEKDWETLKVD
jgi:WG containing repeat